MNLFAIVLCVCTKLFYKDDKELFLNYFALINKTRGCQYNDEYREDLLKDKDCFKKIRKLFSCI